MKQPAKPLTGRIIQNLSGPQKGSFGELLNSKLTQLLSGKVTKDNQPILKEILKEVPFTLDQNTELNLAGYFDTYLLPEARKQKVEKEAIGEIQKQLTKGGGTTISELLDLDGPIKTHPVVGSAYRKSITTEIGSLIGLKGNKLKEFVAKDIIWDEVNKASVNQLLKEKMLTDTQGEKLLWTSDMARLTGNNIPFIQALKKQKVRSLYDVVGWTQQDWSNFIKTNKIQPPPGESSGETYAKKIHTNLKTTFPTQYLGNRLKGADVGAAVNSLKAVKTLHKNNQKILPGREVRSHELDWTGIKTAEKRKIEKELVGLQEFSNTYNGLGIPDIINNPDSSIKDKENSISDRLSAFSTFQENNPGLDLATQDFIKEDNILNWDGIKEELRDPVIKQNLGVQRVENLSDDPETTEVLLKSGFDSAMSIASIPEDKFYDSTGLEYEESRNVYLKAKDIATVTSNYFEAVIDGVQGSFLNLGVSNQKDLVNDLKEINGFDDLFGNQDYCDCEHCRSIFGAAAYFTDLMYFIQEQVSEKHFIPSLTDHPLYLKNRRPDLWTLELSCENTNTEIPYLQVVNEVLESYLIEAEQIKDPYQFINEAQYFTRLPVNVPLQELRIYLQHFEESLQNIYTSLKLRDEQVYREILELGKEEVAIISTADPDQTLLRFGSPQTKDMSVQYFLEMAGISRDQLDQLLLTTFYTDMSKISIQQIKDTSDIQKFEEKFKGLTKNRLDVIYRTLLLWKKTPWTIAEFDLIMNSLKAKKIVSNFTSTTSEGYPRFLLLSRVIQINNELGLSAEELASVINEIPVISIKENLEPFYNRIFDLESLFGIASENADGTVTYKATFVLPADKTQDDKSALIIAGLGISESDLILLFEFLGTDLTVDQTIDYATLSLLYKNAAVTRGLDWSVEDYIHACKLVLDGNAINSLADSNKLIAFNSWLEPSPLSISDLFFIISGEETSANTYEINSDSLAETVFNFQSEYDSLNEENPDPDPGVRTNSIVESLKVYLEDKFNLTRHQLVDQYAANILTQDLEVALTDAANADFNEDGLADDLTDFDGHLSVEEVLERWKLLMDKLDFDDTLFTFLLDHANVFSIADFSALLTDDVKQLVYLKNLKEDLDDDSIGKLNDVLSAYDQSSTISPESIKTLNTIWGYSESVIASVVNSITLNPTATDALNYLYEIVSMTDKFGIQGHSLLKLTAEDYEGIKSARDSVRGAISSKYTDESQRNEVLATYTSAINTIKRDALCDAIIGNKDVYKFSDRTDLYNFFLLDVDMSGCFMTSRIVCANSSLQQYINRCLINLEQSDETLNPNIVDVQVNPNDIPEEEWAWRKNYRVWEANRKIFLYPENYVDPALRDTKSHIFKELEDELLQEKITAESAEEAYKNYMAKFSELTRLRYAGAYYESKANDYGYLPISLGSSSVYLGVQGQRFNYESADSQYYLFARTNTDPYQYYYRTYHHATNTWGNWIKMEVAIEAEEISALVYNGKLFIFWTSTVHKEVSKMEAGNNERIGQDFKLYANYCYQKEDGTWTSPQKTYVGHMLEEENNIFQRVLEENFSGTDEDEEKLEFVLQEFSKKVFKKPYALRNIDNTKAPIKLHYIFSNGQDVIDNNYHVPSSSASIEGMNFDIPYTSFSKIGDAKVVEITVESSEDLITITPSKADASLILASSSGAVLELDEKFDFHVGNIVTIPITVKININVAAGNDSEILSVKRDAFNLSLSKNKILNTTVEEIDESSHSISTSHFLKPEYDTAFADEESFDHYIETGSDSFTDDYRKIHQAEDGTGHLLITDSLGNLQTIPTTTILTDEIIDILYAQGIETFLKLQTQNLSNQFGETFDMKGSYGEYYWEMFFHIPFLIASHLNANQKFKEAKWWYERIFNPTNNEDPNNPDSMDHLWQFREFQNLDAAKLESILTDTNAIDAYKNDPFDPHAIARLRISAYQKAIVMKYIDNLIDWGDYLFTLDTRESITEAMQYYQLAYGLLGKRPIQVGKCDSPETSTLTYENIKDQIDEGSEFLITLENTYITAQNNYYDNLLTVSSTKHLSGYLTNTNLKESPVLLTEVKEVATYVDMRAPIRAEIAKIPNTYTVRTDSKAVANQGITLGSKGARIKKYDDIQLDNYSLAGSYEFGQTWNDKEILSRDIIVETIPARENSFQLAKESILVFCIPENADLMEYWDRVEDRLFKIRNCMNISGTVRSLSLFAPPIDPNFLVRAAASGLSLEDAVQLALTSDLLPNYRFVYLVEKARQYAQIVQGFGTALLSAMEKKDVEELTLLRAVHEQNILKLSLEIKKKQIDDAEHSLKSLQESLVNTENRLNYYTSLVDSGLNAWETTQQISRHAASALRTTSSVFYSNSGIVHLIPELGSPFALKFGGKQAADSLEEWGTFLNVLASISDNIAQSAGLEASFQRRKQEWEHQKVLAAQEIKSMNEQILGAELRKLIAEKDMELQESSIENAKEIHDFYENKFTELGLYNHLSSNLNRIYREAYNLALGMAKLAEKSYQIETFDDSFFIANDNWETDRAGLLAADRLLLQLQQMERSYIDNNSRKPEIRQTFSMALLDPVQLVELKQTGSCTFAIPEIAFELLYPGQIKRVIKGVSITIPCVTGPYTNVGAKLSLTKGLIKMENTDAEPSDYGVGVGASISTSGAVNDSGLFEFNFRDERYLPFEGAGAISEWKLELPSSVRSFDYNTISDVLITLNYTAVDGDRQSAENSLAATFIDYASDPGLFKIVSLRHEFPNEWQLATTTEENMQIELTMDYFPYFTQQYELNIDSVSVHKVGTNHEDSDTTSSSTVAITGQLPLLSLDITIDPNESANELFLVLQYSIST